MDISSSEFVDITTNILPTASYMPLQCSSKLNNLYLAERLGKRFVLKTLKSEFATQSMYQSQFRKEFDLFSQLNHPNIVRFLEIEENPQLGTAIVMEYVDGMTLKEFMATNPNGKIRLKIVRELLMAMSYMHSMQIIHRDLKPSNILITRNGYNLKLIDFGLADGDAYTIFKTTLGTPKYASPEQLSASSELDCRTDIYSFGKILQLLFPHKYKSIARRCMSENVDMRPSSADEVMDLINRSARQKKLLILVGVLLIFFVVFGYYFYKTVKPIQERYVQESSRTLISQQLVADLNGIYQPIIDSIQDGHIKYYEIASARIDKTIPEVFELFRRYEVIAGSDTVLLNELKTTWNTHRSDILRFIYTDYVSGLKLFNDEYSAGRITQAEFDSLCIQWTN